MKPHVLSDLLCFCRTRDVQQVDVVVTNYDTSLVPGMYIIHEVCYLRTSIRAIYFFHSGVIISRVHLKRSICQWHCVYFTTLVAIVHVITSGLWLIRESFNVLIWGKPLQPRYFKGTYLLRRTSCSNICLKSTVLNARKYLQPPDSLLANVLICNITTVIAAIH